MRAWSCGVCEQMVFFDNTACLHCGAQLGYEPGRRQLLTLVGGEDGSGLVPTGPRADGGGVKWWRCANSILAGCNWLVPLGAPSGELCPSCALTRTRPDDDDADGLDAFAKAEAAKRRLVFQLGELGLAVRSRQDDPEQGLAFDLLSSARSPVTTGHADGIITLDLAESDDTHRTQVQQELGEPYRTLLGHFRHEVGHYYWPLLVTGPALEAFRDLFGDERIDYAEAISRHYDGGPPEGWEDRYVSAYSTMHPWEDWAETFAHYLHIRDTLQTAGAFGMLVTGPVDSRTGRRDPMMAAVPDDAIAARDLQEIIATWLPLTYALNAVNRSMGKDDLYPFVLAPTVIEKLDFVHRRTVAAGAIRPEPATG